MAEPLLSVALRGRRDTGPGNPGSPVGGQRAAPLGPMPNEEMDVSNLEVLEKCGSFARYFRAAAEESRKPHETPVKSAGASQLAGGSRGRAWGTSSQASKKSFPEDDSFSRLPAEDVTRAEGSSASDVDPQALLQALKGMDDMEADLLGTSKSSSGPGKTTVKGPGRCDSSGGAVRNTGKLLAPQPLSSPPASRQYKKFNLEDSDDPLAGLLPEREQDAPEKPVPDGDDLLDAMGFGSGSKRDEKQGKKAEEEEVRPAELLGRSSVAKLLEQPGTGERREFKLGEKSQKQPEKEEGRHEEDFVFGTYQPTVASLPRARLTRRQPASGFSAENSSEPKPEPQSKPPPAASRSSVQSGRAGSDWLGLKDDFMESELSSPAKASPAGSHPSPSAARRPSPAGQQPAAKEAATKPDPREEEDWWTAALARKKAQAQAKAQERNAKPSEVPGEGLDLRSPIRCKKLGLSTILSQASSTGARQPAAAPQDKAASAGLSTTTRACARPPEAAKGDPSRDASALVPTALFPWEQETQGPAPLAQVTTPRAHLQAAAQLQAESLAPGLLRDRRPGAPAAQLCKDTSACQAALLSTQARVAELESQVRMLELERTQHKLLLESLQQRRQEELDLLESTHRSQMKVMEETYRQREQRLRQEKEQLAAQLLSQSQDAERARAELVARQQQHVATLEQQSRLELERLQELHRVSIQEMRKDHEEQLQRLKRLKDQEIDAVTSATLHTRSLNRVTEQMEKFSSDLHKLLQKAEATHHTASQELTMEARQRDRQLKVLQDRLLQQQKDMEEEGSRRQEVIAKMEARQSQLAELKIRGRELKAKEEQLARDRELLDKASQELRLEREKVNRAERSIWQREEEMESMKKLFSQKYEEGEQALREASRMESKSQARLQVMQQHLEQLKQQEQRLHQERLSMAHQRRQLEQLREQLPSNPVRLLTARHSPGDSLDNLATAGRAELYATLLQLKHDAQQDHAFLEAERFYLDSLRKASYNTSSLSR
ncbi:fas-binding factor 1 homolog [Rhynochetos jubatus]